MSRTFLAIGAALALLAAAPAADAAVSWGRCPDAAAAPANVVLQCATVRVPLDRADPTGTTLALRVSRARRTGTAVDAGKAMLFLPDGAGSAGWWGAGVPFRRAAVPDGWTVFGLDRRGTGATALVCRALQAQALTGLTRASAGSVEACGATLGEARARYAVADTVADLEDVRAALGLPRWAAVWGVGHGSLVASRLARSVPASMRRVVLEAPVPARSGPDALLRTQLASTPRVLRLLCGDACAGTRVVRALAARARRAESVDLGAGWGSRRRVRIDDAALLDLLAAASTSGDLTDVPAALLADARGDGRPLARLVLRARGAAVVAAVRSQATALATGCLDARVPWGVAAADAPARRAALADAVAELPAAATAPFPSRSAGRNGLVDACVRWPGAPLAPAAVAAPPDSVAALVVTGDLDLATPRADALAEARDWGAAARLPVANGLHGWFDPDSCGEELRRFLGGRSVGSCGFPRFYVRPSFPARLATTPPIAGSVPGRPGRVLAALRDVVLDAVQAADRGERAGLRGGTIRGSSTRLVLADVGLVRDLRVTGTLARRGAGLGDLVGRLQVRGAVTTTAVLRRGQWEVKVGGVPYVIRFDGARVAPRTAGRGESATLRA